ncbi:MAG: YgfZ/GcvT domain-containing protein [Syntrophomonadaceae bacterium]
MPEDTRAPGRPDYGAALSGLAHRRREGSVLAVSGPDREAFLQGQLTQDVRGLTPGSARHAAGLTPKGRLLYFGWVAAEPDRLLLVLPGVPAEPVRAHLLRYAVFQKVSVADVSADHVLFALYGPRAASAAVPRGAILLGREGEIAVGVLLAPDAAAAFEDGLRGAGSVSLSDAAAEALRIEAGRPRFGRDADETNLPDEVGLADTISTTKGCYVGQEVVARLRTYGRVSRRLVGFRLGGGASVETAFPDPEKPAHELARVTSAVASPRFGPIGIGMASRDVAEGRQLETPDGATASVVPLPFA